MGTEAWPGPLISRWSPNSREGGLSVLEIGGGGGLGKNPMVEREEGGECHTGGGKWDDEERAFLWSKKALGVHDALRGGNGLSAKRIRGVNEERGVVERG